MVKNRKKGFTLLEIMIVVAIIALLATIALQNFIKARQVTQKNVCISNLKKIQSAIQVWALDAKASGNTTFTTSDIVPSYLRAWPKEGTVSYPVPSNVEATPVCPNAATNKDHALSQQ